MSDPEAPITAKRLQQALRQTRILPTQAVTIAKVELNWQELQKFAQAYLGTTSVVYPIAFGISSPKSYLGIKIRGPLHTGDVAAEMRWAFLSLHTQQSKLKAALDDEKHIIATLLRGEYATALNRIEQFERDHGHSLSSLFYRFYAVERGTGPKAHKKLLSDINEQSVSNIFLVLFASYISQRAEISCSAESLEEELKKLGRMLEGADTLLAAIRHFAFPLDEACADEAHLLCFCGYLPLIDKYHLLRQISCRISRFSSIEEFLRSDRLIQDPSLLESFHLCFPRAKMIAAKGLSDTEKRLVDIQNCIRSGETEKARDSAAALFASDPEVFEALDAAISLGAFEQEGIKLPQASPLFEIVQTIQGLTRGARSERASLVELRKLALKVPSRGLRHYLTNRCYLSRDWGATNQAQHGDFEVLGRFSDQLYENRNPSKERRELVNHYEALKQTSTTAPTLLATSSWQASGPVPAALSCLGEATRLHFHGDQFGALAILNEVTSYQEIWVALPPGTKITIRRALTELFLATGKVDEAILNAAELLLAGGILDDRLGRALIETVVRSNDSQLHANTYCGILIACLDAPAKQIYPVFENFLSAAGTQSVEDLLGQRPSDTHFSEWLELVCILPVLARSPQYTSTIEAEQARIRICQHLIGENHAVAKLTAEIAELTQKQLIRKGVANVRRSKIYVDESGIRRSAATSLREKFKQFVDSKRTTGASALKLFDATQLSLYLPNAAGELVPQKLQTANIEKDNIRILTHGHFLMFRSLFLDIRNQFVSSNSFGLDSYLSIRVRHGTLQGQLRSPFETQRLILQRLAPGQGYAEGDYWPSRLGLDVLDSRRTTLHSLFSQFSTDVDAEIVAVKDQMIHVTTEERRRQGLFDYSYTDAQLLDVLDSEFEGVGNYDQFVDRAFRVFWQRTLFNLNTVRASLESTTGPHLRDILSRLEIGLRGVFAGGEAQELFQAVTRAYPSLNNALDTVSDWFQPSSQATPEALEAAVIADVAIASYRNIHPGRPFDASISGERSLLMHGRICTPIYDVVAALIDNAFVHSGMHPKRSEVRTDFSFSRDRVVLSVGSSVSTHTDPAKAVETVNQAAEKFMGTANDGALISEGGTGLPKLLKILREDLARQKLALEATQEGARRITVTVSFESDGLAL